MNCLRDACAFQPTLEEVMEEDGLGLTKITARTLSPLAIQIAWIMKVIRGNLKVKTKIMPPGFSRGLRLSLEGLIDRERGFEDNGNPHRSIESKQ
ncbi:hypothetical protein KSP40_PGU011627 [Platanthera guangdongensis]|uniref:Uncharacterized protein n=1 Tax=Platanthera guangdongensis TaxID=2320717 RepID=A0ABR2MQC3_9ASPA